MLTIRSFFLLALALFVGSGPAWAQALPSTTPPLTDIWRAANDAQYGRTGTDPDADFGRDRMYRGTTPANDATFTRRGRSVASAAATASALGKFAKKFGPLSTVLALSELAQDLAAVWRQTSAGDWELVRQVDTSVYEGLNPRTGLYEFTGTLSDVCNGIKGAYESYNDGPYSVSPSGGSCNLQRGAQNISTSVRFVSSGSSLQPFGDAELAGQIKSSSRASDIAGQVDQTPQHDGLPALDPAKIPWSPEVVVLPSPIVLAPRVETFPDGSVKTTQTTLQPSSSATGPIFWTPVTTETVTRPGASPEVTTRDGPTTTPPPEPAPFEMPCGVAGKPPCAVKVDETGVPSTVSMPDMTSGIEADHTRKLNAIKAADGSAWSAVRDFFFLPPAAQCVPFPMPSINGVAVPPLDPCPVVSGIQKVVSVLWSLFAFWVMFGWIREVI